MKIAQFKDRVQLIYGSEKTEKDGDKSIVWEDGEWVWAAINAKPWTTNQGINSEKLFTNRYEVVMKKNYNRHTRHAFKIRIRWYHKLLEIISLLQETEDFKHVSGIAIEKIGAIT